MRAGRGFDARMTGAVPETLSPSITRVGYIYVMKTELVRFGVAMERSLLDHFDVLVKGRGVTRSEVLRDLARAEVVRAQTKRAVPAVASLTLVYDHHVRDLTERLNDIQHELGDRVRSTMHVHLDHHYCLEVIIMRGRSDELQRIAENLLATRGVKHGGIQIVTGLEGGEHASRKNLGHPAPDGKPRRARRAKGETNLKV
jgi:CopG family nickel-responsive transcriptional regulator